MARAAQGSDREPIKQEFSQAFSDLQEVCNMLKTNKNKAQMKSKMRTKI